MTTTFIFAGSGGQGIQFSGKQTAKTGMHVGLNVTFLPSYGPEMRGGTCNCSVVISDDAIGSPLVTAPDVLIAMNLPSLDKFENAVVPGGTIILDSSLIDRKVTRTDVNVHYVDASKLAEENGMKGSANIIIIGKMFKELGFCTEENLFKAVEKCVPPKKAALIDVNKNALRLGFTV